MLVGLAGSAVLAAAPRRGATAAGHRVHPADRAGRGRGPARHLPVLPRAVPAGRDGLAQRLRHELRPQRLLDRLAHDPRRPPEGLGAVALPRVAQPRARPRQPDLPPGPRPAGLALVDRRGEPGRQPRPVHQPDLGGSHARRDRRRPGPGHRHARHQRRHADPPRSLPQGRRRQRLLVDDHAAARLPAVPLPRQAAHVLHVRARRPGRHGLGRLSAPEGDAGPWPWLASSSSRPSACWPS